MRRYEKYKDSGIEWIGEIPEHWESIRLKYIGYLYGGLAGKSANDFNQESNFNNKPFIPFTNICNNKIIDPNQLQQVVIEENEQQNQVSKGDLFFMMSSENFDDVGKSSILLDDLGESYLNSFCKGFRFTKDKYYPQFINYQLLSKAYRSLVLTEANGYTRINLKIDKINDIPLKTPPTLDEQIAIANYLDKKTAEIDELIKQKEELLLLFEEEKEATINQAVTKGINPNVRLKDSKIDWLGGIPEHWEIKKLKYVAEANPSNIDKKTKDDEIEIFLCNYIDVYKNDFINSEIDFMKATASESQIEKFTLRKGDVIATKDSETPADIGNPALVVEDFDNVVCGYHLTHIKPYAVKGEYLFRYFKSRFLKSYFEVSANGITRYGLGVDKFNASPILIPPIEEQQNIIDFIKEETKVIERKVELAENLIEQLKEYKTALISEVATGKVKIN
jgi:type I restriction enzyme S subunit